GATADVDQPAGAGKFGKVDEQRREPARPAAEKHLVGGAVGRVIAGRGGRRRHRRRYLAISQKLVPARGAAGRGVTVRHHASSGSRAQASRTLMPAQNRFQPTNRCCGTAITTGMSAVTACLISSTKPRPDISSLPNRLMMTTWAPSAIAL